MKLILNICCAALSLTSVAQQQKMYPEGIEHVIVIGVDGLSPDGIRNAATPVLNKMIAGGSVKWNVRTVLPSSSSPNWASMIMGAGVEQHGITDNDWEQDKYSLPAIVKDENGFFPTIFGVVHKNRPSAEIGIAHHWGGFGRLVENNATTYKKHFETEDSTTTAFINYVRQHKPLLAFLHLDHVDHAGHHDGHGTEAYYTSVSKTDSLIGEVLQSIKNAGIEKNTLVIVTADHGGIGYGHGGATVEEAEIAMILYGKGIKKNYEIPEQVVTYDLAATIAFALKIIPPYVWTGRPLKSAFEGFNPPSNLWLGRSLIPLPVIYPKRNLYEQAGGLYINTTPTVTIKTVAKNATTHYTTDGSEPNSTSPVYTGRFSLNKTTVIKARSFDKNHNESNVSTAYFRVAGSSGDNGVHVAFYKGANWKYLPLFKDLQPAAEWNSLEFNLSREKIAPLLDKDNNTFGAVFTGFIEIDTDGEYTFYSSSDDGSKLYVNNNMVVNNDGDHAVTERSGSVHLTKGFHPIRIEYYNGDGGFWLDAFYEGPGVSKQLIPANKLFIKIPMR